MDYLSAIARRCSRRKYTPQALPPEVVEALQASIDRYNRMSGLSIQIVTQNGDAFEGFRKSYGMFVGVRNYFAMIGDESDEFRMEKEGYYGEKLVLEATLLGLGTCWVGTNYDRASCACKIGPEQTLDCVITVGYVEEALSIKEKMMARMMGKNKKSVEELCSVTGKAEPWFVSGMHAVEKAPSTRNLQPVHFTCKDETVRAAVEDMKDRQPIDLGIAKLHFEIGAGDGNWQWGNDAEYRRPAALIK